MVSIFWYFARFSLSLSPIYSINLIINVHLRSKMKKLNIISMALCAMMGTATLTSCEGTLDDVFGEWSRPTKALSIEETPLTFEAVEAGTIKVTYNGGMTLPKPITYTKNGVSTSITATTDIAVAAGDVVSFSSENSSVNTGAKGCYLNILADHKIYVYGNVMSLINDEGDFSKDKTISGDYALAKLFRDNTELYIHPEKKLLLPATTLANQCYSSMFYNCTSLTTAPELPATTLALGCYYNMFGFCTGLTTAPVLPATTLDNGCYEYMFYYCTGLKNAPKLPATTLANYCYYCMFWGCNSITTAPALPATTLAVGCYSYMFYQCPGLTTASELPATTLAEECYEGMYDGCTSLSTAPELPATTLARDCYSGMFCYTNLTTAPALPATTLDAGCYSYMFSDCYSLTTAPELPATTLADECYINMFENCSKLSSVSCKATSEINSTNLKDWLKEAGTDATSPTLHVTTGKESESWNLPTTPGTWTVKGDL